MRQKVPSKPTSGQIVPQKPKNPPDQRGVTKNIRLETLLHYKKLGLGFAEIGRQVGCDRTNVYKRLQHYDLLDDSLNHYVNHRVDYLRFWQRRILDSITDEDLKKANFAAKLTGYGILYDKERLELGQSTGNIAMLIGHIESIQRGTIMPGSSTIDTITTDITDMGDNLGSDNVNAGL